MHGTMSIKFAIFDILTGMLMEIRLLLDVFVNMTTDL